MEAGIDGTVTVTLRYLIGNTERWLELFYDFLKQLSNAFTKDMRKAV
jgi:hypothetical protein